MSKHFDPSTLPDDVARAAAAQVAAGRFASVEDVVRAGIAAVEREDAPALPPHDWADYMRYRFEEGRKAFARGEAIPTSPDELMDSIERELGLA